MIKRAINYALSKFDLALHRYSSLEKMKIDLQRYSSDFRDIDFLRSLEDRDVVSSLRNLDRSKSQFRQDLFVLAELNYKRSGFFVEFGATNGIDSSNTFLLEKEYAWTGILAEPAKVWHRELLKNRDAHIELSCVWSRSNDSISFVETQDAVLSTATKFISGDAHASNRQPRTRYVVNTISLEDLLLKYDAPRYIDYLSIDTEGSEFEILKEFDFRKYHFFIITCEHNFGPNRARIRKLLERHGYKRKLEHVSCVDDWFVRDV